MLLSNSTPVSFGQSQLPKMMDQPKVSVAVRQSESNRIGSGRFSEEKCMRFHGHKKLQILFFPFMLVGIAAASPDLRLLSLVPPGAQLVAGVGASTIESQPDNFVLITPNNRVDLQDFFSLTGADDTRSIHQIVFVAVANKDGQASEHSLLVSGRFDQPHVFKSAVDGGATVTNYGGIPVLEIQPFAREHRTFKGVRWLAILDSTVLVFGSVATTQIELNRYLLQNHADESLLRRLATHLHAEIGNAEFGQC